MTPVQYHLIGLAMVMIALLIGRFGPEEIRGFPSGIETKWGRFALLVFVVLAWPPVAIIYVFGAVTYILQWGLRLGFWERAVQSVFAAVATGMVVGAGYWLVFIALPFLLHWYGFVS